MEPKVSFPELWKEVLPFFRGVQGLTCGMWHDTRAEQGTQDIPEHQGNEKRGGKYPKNLFGFIKVIKTKNCCLSIEPETSPGFPLGWEGSAWPRSDAGWKTWKLQKFPCPQNRGWRWNCRSRVLQFPAIICWVFSNIIVNIRNKPKNISIFKAKPSQGCSILSHFCHPINLSCCISPQISQKQLISQDFCQAAETMSCLKITKKTTLPQICSGSTLQAGFPLQIPAVKE